MALDIMGTLSGGGVYDWLDAELYEAEGNDAMAAANRFFVVVPGAVMATKQAVSGAIDIHKMTKGADLMELALKAFYLA